MNHASFGDVSSGANLAPGPSTWCILFQTWPCLCGDFDADVSKPSQRCGSGAACLASRHVLGNGCCQRASSDMLSTPDTKSFFSRHVLPVANFGTKATLFNSTVYLAQVRCVRADSVTRIDLQPSSPSLIFYPYKQRPALAGWVADDRANTFVGVSHDGSPQLLQAFRFKGVEDQQSNKGSTATGTKDGLFVSSLEFAG